MVTTYIWFDLLNFVCILFILNSESTRFQTVQRDEHNELGIPGAFPFKLWNDTWKQVGNKIYSVVSLHVARFP